MDEMSGQFCTMNATLGGNPGKGEPAKPKPHCQANLLSPTEKCKVCKEPAAKHIHYGAMTCFSCRAFFRRSIQNKTSGTYVCRRNQNCDISLKTRKNCQFCRYQLCLRVGMKPSWVLSEEERSRRFKKNRLRKSQEKADDDVANMGGGNDEDDFRNNGAEFEVSEFLDPENLNVLVSLANAPTVTLANPGLGAQVSTIQPLQNVQQSAMFDYHPQQHVKLEQQEIKQEPFYRTSSDPDLDNIVFTPVAPRPTLVIRPPETHHQQLYTPPVVVQSRPAPPRPTLSNNVKVIIATKDVTHGKNTLSLSPITSSIQGITVSQPNPGLNSACYSPAPSVGCSSVGALSSPGSSVCPSPVPRMSDERRSLIMEEPPLDVFNENGYPLVSPHSQPPMIKTLGRLNPLPPTPQPKPIFRQPIKDCSKMEQQATSAAPVMTSSSFFSGEQSFSGSGERGAELPDALPNLVTDGEIDFDEIDAHSNSNSNSTVISLNSDEQYMTSSDEETPHMVIPYCSEPEIIFGEDEKCALDEIVKKHDERYRSVNFGEALIKEMIMCSVFGIPISVDAALAGYRLSVERITRIAHDLHSFRGLSKEDQNLLLKENADLLVSLRSCIFFDARKKGVDQVLISMGIDDMETIKTVFNPIIRNSRLKHIDYKTFNSIQTITDSSTEVRYNYLQEKVAQQLQDDVIPILLTYIILFSADMTTIGERRRVENIQDQYTRMLQRYLYSKHPRPTASLILAEALCSITRIREMAEIKKVRTINSNVKL